MRLVFTPAEHEEFYVARDQLAEAFLAWAGERGLEVDPFVLAVAVDFKYGVDGRLGRWGRADVRTMLTDWFPRKVTMLEPDRAGVAPSLHAMVDFLADQRLMDRSSARVGELHAEIDRHVPALLAGMADERSYDLGKFWGTKMLQHDVDVSDQAAVERFIAAAHAGEIDIDNDVLEEIVQRQFFGGAPDPLDRPELPPVLLPDPEELRTAAEASVLLARLRAFTRWLGTGRTLTKTGRLTMADGRELAELLDVDRPFLARARSSIDLPDVSLLLHWAKAVRLVRIVKGRLVPVKAAVPLLGEPVELWQRAFDAFGALGEQLCGPPGGYQVFSMLRYFFAETLPVMWLGLYTAGGSLVPVELIHELVRDALAEEHGFEEDSPLGDVQHLLWRRDVTNAIAALELLGAVRLEESTDQVERAKIAELSGQEDPDTTLVQLTPIGLWAVHRVLLEEGVDAPAVGELAGEEIEVVCDRLAQAAPEAVEAELAAWVDARGAQAAASELAHFVQSTEKPSGRMFGIAALAQAGESGREAARWIRAGGGVAGAMATTWLVEQDALDPSSLTQAEMLLGLADHLAVLHDQGCLVDELASRPVAEQIDLVRRLAHVDHPYRPEMLDALGKEHPDRDVARAARKARLTLS